jgi:hypothetical protein
MRKRLQQTFAKKNAYKCTCELNQRDKKKKACFYHESIREKQAS